MFQINIFKRNYDQKLIKKLQKVQRKFRKFKFLNFKKFRKFFHHLQWFHLVNNIWVRRLTISDIGVTIMKWKLKRLSVVIRKMLNKSF